MSAQPKEVLVTVTLAPFGRYHALATDGSFFSQKHALSKTSGPDAALRAAAKFLRVPANEITLQKSAPGVFVATVIVVPVSEPTATTR